MLFLRCEIAIISFRFAERHVLLDIRRNWAVLRWMFGALKVGH
jgi:hypothetical protein